MLMNGLKFAVMAASVMMTWAAAKAYDINATSTIPSNVTAVYPTPDQRVDIGPNANPLGVQQISVVFDHEITVNADCTAEAHIYRDGEDEPFQSVGISGVSVDLFDSSTGSVLFPHSCKYNGNYRITIPEGFWVIEGDTPTLNAPLDLYYEIYLPQLISPAESVVKELSEFRLEFPDFDEAKVVDASKIEFFRLASADRYGITVSEGKNEDGTPANFILIKLDNPVTAQGEYNLFVQAGAAEGIYYGGTQDNAEPTEITTEPNIEALYHYTISLIDTPAIVPAEGVIESFTQFELTVPEGAEFWFINDKAVSFIYPVNDDGTLAPDPICRLTGNRIEGTEKILLEINDNGKVLDSFTPDPGKYALQLASGLFSGSWDGEFINSAPFIYYYETTGTPDDPVDPGKVETLPGAAQAQDGTIYRLDGTRMSDNANSLPNGVYVVKGKKTLISK